METRFVLNGVVEEQVIAAFPTFYPFVNKNGDICAVEQLFLPFEDFILSGRYTNRG